MTKTECGIGKETMIRELLRIDVIDTSDAKKLVEIQDRLNVTGAEAQEIMQSLTYGEKTRLLWLVTTACGYDAFLFWFHHGFKIPLQAALSEYNKQAMDDLDERFAEAHRRERELDDREKSLAVRQRRLRQLAQLEAGQEVARLRHEVRNLQEQLAEERRNNGKARMIMRIMS